ncbi:hypothetical protein D2V08_03520 [Flagellimonas lutimaris]|uniref:Uncharacterized protein n=1 Tax=Flagellimonas lutimaris TaxID=475082 RepID=A0A3A1NCF4_9FLAO|nr:hypothetical protein D2V08_03520 [Allomuricauda lutimaris]
MLNVMNLLHFLGLGLCLQFLFEAWPTPKFPFNYQEDHMYILPEANETQWSAASPKSCQTNLTERGKFYPNHNGIMVYSTFP